MEKFIIQGGKKLQGSVSVSGAKNVALKALVAACLTKDEVVIKNIPYISDLFVMKEIIEELGGQVEVKDHVARVKMEHFTSHMVSLEKAAQTRTSSMFLAPLLTRVGEALIPNPGGCRIGARPIDRTIDGLCAMGIKIQYKSNDGYFHATSKNQHLEHKNLDGISYRFEKNTHTGTETLLLASVLAHGRSVLHNAAQEPEVDELITLLSGMGAKIKREDGRKIVIDGVEKLHGTTFTISPDRNEIVTFAIAAYITDGDIFVKGAQKKYLLEFLEKVQEAGGGFEEKKNGIRFYAKDTLKATSVTTSFYPGFMTDWQGPWAVLMSKAIGQSTIHETIFENRFGYVEELLKMGAKINYYDPKVKNPKDFYNFNYDEENKTPQSIKIHGKTNLHNAIVNASDLRAGATLVLGALAAHGTSILFGVERLDRGYEKFEERLQSLGADIRRERE